MSKASQPASPADFELGRSALLEITTADTVGANAGSIIEDDGTVTVYFETTQPGYVGWRWTVSIAHVDGFEPSVLETELTPGDGALLSPAWVPWADRMAEYTEAQAALAEDSDASDDDDDDDHDDDDFDDNDVNDDDDALLHSGDLDGVDIDSLDEDDDADGAASDEELVVADRAGADSAPATSEDSGVAEEQHAQTEAGQAKVNRRAPRRRALRKDRD